MSKFTCISVLFLSSLLGECDPMAGARSTPSGSLGNGGKSAPWANAQGVARALTYLRPDRGRPCPFGRGDERCPNQAVVRSRAGPVRSDHALNFMGEIKVKVCHVLLLSAAVSLVGCGVPGAEVDTLKERATALKQTERHAENVYGHYQGAASGRITFSLATLESGRVSDVLSRSVNEIVGVPDYRITMKQLGTDLTSVSLETRDPATDEWVAPVLLSKFDKLGRSTDAAEYRLLSIGVIVDGKPSEHRSLEVCWAAESYCLVMDPVVENLEAFALDRARLLAQGWKVEQTTTPPAAGGIGTMAVCAMGRNHSWGGYTLTWGSYTRTYKNVYNITVAEHYLGAQQTGISCYISGSSCLAGAYGYSNTSSCYANLGFNCDCDNTGNQTGTSSNAARAWSESKCEHKNVLQGSANVSWSKGGVGANFSINWATSGGTVHSNGGTLYDYCAWF
jgi:hypothetical protein